MLCGSLLFLGVSGGSCGYNTPNAIIAPNESLEIQQINKAALQLMNIAGASDVMGEQIIRIHDPGVFIDIMDSGKSILVLFSPRFLHSQNHFSAEQAFSHPKKMFPKLCIFRVRGKNPCPRTHFVHKL